MTAAYLGLGSNTNPHRHLQAGIAALRDAFGSVSLSPVYLGPAKGFKGRDFINLVAAIETTMDAPRLQAWLRDLEFRHGRTLDQPKYSDRTLDIDLLLHGEARMNGPGLVLPRPDILHCAYVLRPLAELAPDLPIPGLNRTAGELWAAFDSEGEPLQAIDGRFLSEENHR